MNRQPQKSKLTKWETKMAKETIGFIYEEEGEYLGLVTIFDSKKLLQKWANDRAGFYKFPFFIGPQSQIYSHITQDTFGQEVRRIISLLNRLGQPDKRNRKDRQFMERFYQDLSVIIRDFIRLGAQFSPEVTYWAICKSKHIQFGEIEQYSKFYPNLFQAFCDFKKALSENLRKVPYINQLFDINDNRLDKVQIQKHNKVEIQDEPQNEIIIDLEEAYENLQIERYNAMIGQEKDKDGGEEDKKDEKQEDQFEKTESELSDLDLNSIITRGQDLELEFNFLYGQFKQLLIDPTLQKPDNTKVLFSTLIHYNDAIDTILSISNNGLSEPNGYFAQSSLFQEMAGQEYYKIGDREFEMDIERQQYLHLSYQDMINLNILDKGDIPFPSNLALIIRQYPDGHLEFQSVTAFFKGNVYLIGEDKILNSQEEDKDGGQEDKMEEFQEGIPEEMDQIMDEEEEFRRALGIQQPREDKIHEEDIIDIDE